MLLVRTGNKQIGKEDFLFFIFLTFFLKEVLYEMLLSRARNEHIGDFSDLFLHFARPFFSIGTLHFDGTFTSRAERKRRRKVL